MAETTVMIISTPPYGSEQPWNALRLAKALVVTKQTIKLFLLGDGVGMAKKGQAPPAGYYNLGQTLTDLLASGVEVRACGTCVASRGLKSEELVDGVIVGKMLDLARWVGEASKVLSF